MNYKRPDGSPVSVEIHAAPLVGARRAPAGRRGDPLLDDQVPFLSQEQRLAVGLLANGAWPTRSTARWRRSAWRYSPACAGWGWLDGHRRSQRRYLELVDAEIDRVLITQRP